MNGTIRIFHVIGGEVETGGEHFLPQMLDRMDRHIFPMAVALPEKTGLSDEMRRRHVPFEKIPLSPARILTSVRSLEKIFGEWQPDLVHTHGLRAGVIARMACGTTPCICSIHNDAKKMGVIEKHLLRFIDRVTVNRCSVIVCDDESLRTAFLRRCPVAWEKTHVIPRGVDLERFDPRRVDRVASRRGLGLSDHWTLLIPQDTTWREGPEILMKCVANIKALLPPIKIIILKTRGGEQDLKKLAMKLGLDRDIKIVEEKKDRADLLSATDLMITPSPIDEGGMILLEAMAMEVPILSIPEKVAGSLEESLLKLLWDKAETKKQVELRKRQVQLEFDCKKSFAKWEGLYRELSGDILIR